MCVCVCFFLRGFFIIIIVEYSPKPYSNYEGFYMNCSGGQEVSGEG